MHRLGRYQRMLSLAIWLLLGTALSAVAGEPVGVATLLEENAADLLKVLTNPTGDPGEGFVETTHVFSGKQAIRIVPMQRFHNQIPGWAYPIREHPKPGEYRYLRFAWKAEGGTGIMVQLHSEKSWQTRYTAGRDMYSWGTKYVAEQPPKHWSLVTCDLFADFGEQTFTGIALTNFDSPAAYFDHIYLARTREELDRIDTTGFREGKLPELTDTELETLWSQLANLDAQQAYQAQWRLVAAHRQAVPYIAARLDKDGTIAGAERIRQWIKMLDDDRYVVRERATRQLAVYAVEARPALEQALANKPSAEVEWRVKGLLVEKTAGDPSQRLREQTQRVLTLIDTSESQTLLQRYFRKE